MIITKYTRLNSCKNAILEDDELYILAEESKLYAVKRLRQFTSIDLLTLQRLQNNGCAYEDMLNEIGLYSKPKEYHEIDLRVVYTLTRLGKSLKCGSNTILFESYLGKFVMVVSSKRVAWSLAEQLEIAEEEDLQEILKAYGDEICWSFIGVDGSTKESELVEKFIGTEPIVEPVEEPVEKFMDLSFDLEEEEGPEPVTPVEKLLGTEPVKEWETDSEIGGIRSVSFDSTDRNGEMSRKYKNRDDFREILRDNKDMLDNQRMYMFGKRFLRPQLYNVEEVLNTRVKMSKRLKERINDGWLVRDEKQCIISSGNHYMGKISHISNYVDFILGDGRNHDEGEQFSADKYYKYGIEMAIGRPIGDTQEQREKDVVDFLKYAKECMKYFIGRSRYRPIDRALYEGYDVDRLFYIACSLPSSVPTDNRTKIKLCWELECVGVDIKSLAVKNGLLTNQHISLIQEHIAHNPIGLEVQGWYYIIRRLGGYGCKEAMLEQTLYRCGIPQRGMDQHPVKSLLNKAVPYIDDEDVVCLNDEDVLYLKIYKSMLKRILAFNKQLQTLIPCVGVEILVNEGYTALSSGGAMLSVVTGESYVDWEDVFIVRKGEPVKELYVNVRDKLKAYNNRYKKNER